MERNPDNGESFSRGLPPFSSLPSTNYSRFGSVRHGFSQSYYHGHAFPPIESQYLQPITDFTGSQQIATAAMNLLPSNSFSNISLTKRDSEDTLMTIPDLSRRTSQVKEEAFDLRNLQMTTFYERHTKQSSQILCCRFVIY